MPSSIAPSGLPASSRQPHEVEDVVEYEEISDEVSSGRAGSSPASEPTASDFALDDEAQAAEERREWLRSLTCTLASAGVHMAVFLVLSLVLGTIKLPAPPPIAFDI